MTTRPHPIRTGAPPAARHRRRARRPLAGVALVALAALVLTSCMVGGSWTSAALPSGVDVTTPGAPTFVTEVDCASATHCVALAWDDGAPVTAVWDGTSWSTAPAPTRPEFGWSRFPEVVGCWAPSTCLAVGTGDFFEGSIDVAGYLWDGTSWTQTPGYVDAYYGVGDCTPTGSYCLVSPIGDPSSMAEYVGGTWQPAWVGADDFGDVSEWARPVMSCATADWCVIVRRPDAPGGVGPAVFLIEEKTPTIIPTPFEITSLDCTSPTFCLGAGPGGHLRWDGATWSTVPVQDVPTPEAATDISCAADQRCLLVAPTATYAFWGAGDGSLARTPARPSGGSGSARTGCAWAARTCMVVQGPPPGTSAVYRW